MGDFIYGFLIGRVIGGIFVLACKIVWFFLRIAWWLSVFLLLWIGAGVVFLFRGGRRAREDAERLGRYLDDGTGWQDEASGDVYPLSGERERCEIHAVEAGTYWRRTAISRLLRGGAILRYRFAALTDAGSGRRRGAAAWCEAIGRPGVKRLIAVGGRGMRMTRGAAAAVVLAAVLLAGAAVAGCGASGTLPQQAATGSSAPAVAPSCLGNTAIVPGNCTPEQAADGYFQSQLAGNWTQTCAYVVPSGQGACQQAASSADIGPLTGNLAVGAEMIQGAEAIVGAAGSLCSSSCDYSTPANIDFPSGYGSAFTTAYAQTISTMTSPGSNFSPLPCLEVDGLWYVNIPGPLGGFPWS